MNNIKIISKKLNSIWKKLYIVWGWCRNSILNLEKNTDIDLTTDATPEEVKSVLNVIKEVGKKYWTQIIIEWNETFEITTFRSDIWILNNRKPVKVQFTSDLILDSKRRDFRFNSIYFDVLENKFIDPNDWIWDLNSWYINFVWDISERIKEDALRILRYVRFKFKYNLKEKSDYKNIISKNIYLLKNISIERLVDEFNKILLLKNNCDALDYLMDIWFFDVFIQEVSKLKLTNWWKPHHLEWNVWIHTLLTIKELNKIISSNFLIDNYSLNNLKSTFSQDEKLILYRTLLLHDIAKFNTYSVDKNQNVHYYNHEVIWSEIFLEISKKLKFSNNYTSIIKYLIKNHLRIFKIFEMKELKAKKFMLDKYFIYLIIIAISDNNWRIPAKNDLNKKLLDKYLLFKNEYSKMNFYNGNEILKMFPLIKWSEIKQKLEEKNNEILLWKTKKL